MRIELLYFASLADKLGCDRESLDWQGGTVADLKALLSTRGADTWAPLINANSTRCAINQQLAQDDSEIPSGAEVAFFPPVTGG